MEIDWMEVRSGTLVRGTPTEEIDEVVVRHRDYGLPRSYFAKEAPRSEVAVPGFAMARTTVTVAQWNDFRRHAGGASVDLDPRWPIEQVGWSDAVSFCEWASAQLDMSVRLPSEDEWERAARGDDTREYPWGDAFEARRANLAELGLGHPLPVGSLPLGASPFGLLDMAGNVDEWTATVYAPRPDAPPDVPPSEPQAFDPHVTRGGNYHTFKDLARCARRHAIYQPGGGAGFRLVTSL